MGIKTKKKRRQFHQFQYVGHSGVKNLPQSNAFTHFRTRIIGINDTSSSNACYLLLFFGLSLLKAINVTAADKEYLQINEIDVSKRYDRRPGI